MAFIDFEVKTDLREKLKFDEFPTKAHDRLLERITALTAEMYARVVAAEPSRSGRLRALTKEAVYDNTAGESIRGMVSFSGDWAKVAALEYGAHKPTKVSAHMMRLDHVFAERLASPLQVMVAAHSRTPDIAAHRFLRGTLDAMRGEIVEELRAAVAQAVAESQP